MRASIKLFASYTSNKNHRFDTVELSYSRLHFLSGNKRWFCRVWAIDWIKRIGIGKKDFGESYGANKFEAYRNAVNNLNQ